MEAQVMALRVISPVRNNPVAFGSKRTIDGRRQRLAQLKMILSDITPLVPPPCACPA
jgi:hypothetical protein